MASKEKKKQRPQAVLCPESFRLQKPHRPPPPPCDTSESPPVGALHWRCQQKGGLPSDKSYVLSETTLPLFLICPCFSPPKKMCFLKAFENG